LVLEVAEKKNAQDGEVEGAAGGRERVKRIGFVD
jgi:hypothetical protein